MLQYEKIRWSPLSLVLLLVLPLVDEPVHCQAPEVSAAAVAGSLYDRHIYIWAFGPWLERIANPHSISLIAVRPTTGASPGNTQALRLTHAVGREIRYGWIIRARWPEEYVSEVRVEDASGTVPTELDIPALPELQNEPCPDGIAAFIDEALALRIHEDVDIRHVGYDALLRSTLLLSYAPGDHRRVNHWRRMKSWIGGRLADRLWSWPIGAERAAYERMARAFWGFGNNLAFDSVDDIAWMVKGQLGRRELEFPLTTAAAIDRVLVDAAHSWFFEKKRILLRKASYREAEPALEKAGLQMLGEVKQIATSMIGDREFAERLVEECLTGPAAAAKIWQKRPLLEFPKEEAEGAGAADASLPIHDIGRAWIQPLRACVVVDVDKVWAAIPTILAPEIVRTGESGDVPRVEVVLQTEEGGSGTLPEEIVWNRRGRLLWDCWLRLADAGWRGRAIFGSSGLDGDATAVRERSVEVAPSDPREKWVLPIVEWLYALADSPSPCVRSVAEGLAQWVNKQTALAQGEFLWRCRQEAALKSSVVRRWLPYSKLTGTWSIGELMVLLETSGTLEVAIHECGRAYLEELVVAWFQGDRDFANWRKARRARWVRLEQELSTRLEARAVLLVLQHIEREEQRLGKLLEESAQEGLFRPMG
ncbi:MAG: hypothetical protein JXB04_00090 [Kiritimatiellae bacterium]|nr:hypothetical protein [Kiritimatiellia bacterium]